MTEPEEQERPAGGRVFCVDRTPSVYNPSNHMPRRMPAQIGPPDSSWFVRCIPCFLACTGVPCSDRYREHHSGDLYPVREA
jgi:hypothetical protein